MNRATEDSEQGFQEWLKVNGWIEDDEDYCQHEYTGIPRTRVFLHGLYIAEQKLKAWRG